MVQANTCAGDRTRVSLLSESPPPSRIICTQCIPWGSGAGCSAQRQRHACWQWGLGGMWSTHRPQRAPAVPPARCLRRRDGGGRGGDERGGERGRHRLGSAALQPREVFHVVHGLHRPATRRPCPLPGNRRGFVACGQVRSRFRPSSLHKRTRGDACSAPANRGSFSFFTLKLRLLPRFPASLSSRSSRLLRRRLEGTQPEVIRAAFRGD